jgi:hypothetical protein
MTKLIAALSGIVVSLVLLGGASAADEARVRVIHASPDAPAVDVYANGSQVLSNVPFQASSGYLSVPADRYTFEIYAAGADPTTTGAVLTVSADLQAGADYTVIALDSVAQIKGRIFGDDNTAPAPGQAHINVIHAGPDAPAVDVAVTGGDVLVSDLGFGSKEGPLPVAAGTYDLELRVAGTTTVALPLPDIELQAGVVYTFVATGYLNDTPALTVVAYTETPTPTIAPPSTGDGGLKDVSSRDSLVLYALFASVVLLTGARIAASVVRRPGAP